QKPGHHKGASRKDNKPARRTLSVIPLESTDVASVSVRWADDGIINIGPVMAALIDMSAERVALVNCRAVRKQSMRWRKPTVHLQSLDPWIDRCGQSADQIAIDSIFQTGTALADANEIELFAQDNTRDIWRVSRETW